MQSLNAEIDQYKDILKKFKDYDEDILKQRMKNAEKDREAMKLRVSACDSNSTSDIMTKCCLLPCSFTPLGASPIERGEKVEGGGGAYQTPAT